MTVTPYKMIWYSTTSGRGEAYKYSTVCLYNINTLSLLSSLFVWSLPLLSLVCFPMCSRSTDSEILKLWKLTAFGKTDPELRGSDLSNVSSWREHGVQSRQGTCDLKLWKLAVCPIPLLTLSLLTLLESNFPGNPQVFSQVFLLHTVTLWISESLTPA